MKRREFLSTAGAAAAMPMLPLPAIPTPAAASGVPVATANWAALFARVNAGATPELIQTWLGVAPEQARALMSDLVQRNILHAPVAGSAAAVQPMYAPQSIPGMQSNVSKIADLAQDILDAVPDGAGPPDDNAPEPEVTDEPS